jgi:hypothetical protein
MRRRQFGDHCVVRTASRAILPFTLASNVRLVFFIICSINHDRTV